MPGVTAPIVPGRPGVWEGLAFSLCNLFLFYNVVFSYPEVLRSNPIKVIVIAGTSLNRGMLVNRECGQQTDSVELRFGGDGRQYILGSRSSSSISFFGID